MDDPRALICEIGLLMYERRLTDSAGGNISLRVGDRICMSPRYAGSRKRWRLQPPDVMVTDLAGNVLEGAGELTRESRMHCAIYAAFPQAGGICHAHPLNAMVFASLRRPIPPTNEQTEKYGVIGLAREVPAHSADLAAAVVDALRPTADRLPRVPVGCLLPRHGITVVGAGLGEAFDALERIDGSCYTLIASGALTR